MSIKNIILPCIIKIYIVFQIFSLKPGFHPMVCVILMLNGELDVYLETSSYILQLYSGNCNNIVLILPHCRRDFLHDTNRMNTF